MRRHKRGSDGDSAGQQLPNSKHVIPRGLQSATRASVGVGEGCLCSRSLTIVTLGPRGLAGPEGGGALAAGGDLGAPGLPAGAGVEAGVLALPVLQRPCLKAIIGTLAARRTEDALIVSVSPKSSSSE